MRVKLVLAVMIGVTLLSLPVAAVSPEAVKNSELLEALHIQIYPTRDSLTNSKLSEENVSFEALNDRDIDSAFANINDLEWLRPISKRCKVLMFGEEHYSGTVSNLVNRTLFALNQFDRYPLLVVELPYSYSAYFDHYVSLSLDADAKSFYDKALYEIVGNEEMYRTLEHIRHWNIRYPNRLIHVGASDLEHNFSYTIKRVLVPYLQKIDPTYDVKQEELTLTSLRMILKQAREKMAPSDSKSVTGEYSFITTSYIENVLSNLESTYRSYYYEFDYYRQKAIVRNLTDPKFFGRYLIDDKVMIYGGSYHTTTHFEYPDGGNFYREGSYLNFDFAPTKGKTYSIMTSVIARTLGKMATISLDSCLFQGTGYIDIVKRLQKAYENKLITANTPCMIDWRSSEFDLLTMKAAYRFEMKPMRITAIDWSELRKDAARVNPATAKDLKRLADTYQRYDEVIIIPQSPLQVAARKR